MATSLTGVGAVWASLSLVAAVLCCAGFYLPFWIQRKPMNKKLEATGRRRRLAGTEENPAQANAPGCKPGAYLNEEILIADEPMTQGQVPEDGAVMFIHDGESDGGQIQTTNLDVLLAAWWKYKRENKQKKKKRKPLKIYRDENYWNDGKFTDDEDFA